MAISTPRALPLQHMARVVQARRDRVSPDPPPLGRDQMQLYSYYRPGLVAGDYEITVEQDISATIPGSSSDHAKVQKLQVTNVRINSTRTSNTPVAEPQRFEVVVPRFTLDQTLINSYYPPDGHQDEGRILPHIVLNDPHYPWEIDAGSSTNMSGPVDGDRNLVPWVALIVFDPDDLRIPTMDEITALGIASIDDVNKQNAHGTFSMQVQDYFSDLRVPKDARVDFDKGFGKDVDLLNEVKSTTDTAQVIFPTKELFSHIFQDCEALKYLAHVRNINTTGFPDAGIEQMALYSVVVSCRTGQFDITKPSTQICHLVSIENVDVTLDGVHRWLNGDQKTGSKRIGLFSLFSWVYTALPPDPVNFVDTVENLVRKQQMFRADEAITQAMESSHEKSTDPPTAGSKASRVLLDRLKMGYTFARWRPETGEETSAINRGPLVPQQVSDPAADMPDCSNTSKEFQIVDKSTGLTDLSYSSAWQLGKTLAIADTVFSSALLRFRSSLHNLSAAETRSTMNQSTPKTALIQSLSASMQHVNQLSAQAGPPRRLQAATGAPVVVDVQSPEAKPIFMEKLAANVADKSSAGPTPFNGFNVDPANDNDWALIHDWMANKLFLADIPPHYLVPESSFLPSEGLRFFYIDDFWIDCLLDGALSVANHLDHHDDALRVEIKRRFNKYLREKVPDSGIKPQIPGYGFILRSKIVKAMPDLRITVNWLIDDPVGHKRHPVCRYTKFDDTTLICLLDRSPEELESIVLAQPPHQQRFSLGYSLTGPRPATDKHPALLGRLEFKLRKLYTKNPPAGEWKTSIAQPTMGVDAAHAKDDQTQQWFNWDTRCLQLRNMAAGINKIIQREPQAPPNQDGEYIDLVPNSCELALELNDPSYYFVIRPPKLPGKLVPQPADGSAVKPPDRVIVPRDRQLYINETADKAQDPPIKKATAPATQAVLAMARRGKSKSTMSRPAASSTASSPPPMAPHIQTKTPPFRASSRLKLLAAAAGPLQLQSQFTFATYADYKPFANPRTSDGYDPNAYLPTQNVFLYDLIFSIRKRVAASSFQLLEIQIDFPTDDAPRRPPPPEPLLRAPYSGEGGRMLSNQRFTPLLFADAGRLRVRLLPRTVADGYRFSLGDAKSAEMSFRLAQPEVASVKAGVFLPMRGSPGKPQWRGLASATVVEMYATPAGNGTVTTKVDVVKWATRDVEDVALEAAESHDISAV